MKKIILITFLFSFTELVNAICGVTNTKVTQMHRYSDGTLFISTDKPNDCGCSQTSRLAIKSEKVDGDSFTTSAALTALVAGQSVDIFGLDGCDVHGNTAELSTLTIYAN